MTTAVLDDLGGRRAADGGAPARRAMLRWAWRLLRREWRQQLLIFALVVVAVAAAILGAAVALNSGPPGNAGFGSAHDRAILPGNTPHLSREVAQLSRRYRPVDVIESRTLRLPGSVHSYALIAASPHGRFSGSLVSLITGRYPASAGQVAMTQDLAHDFHLRLGELWHQGGATRRLVGLVEDPQNLLESFALVPPGQVTSPTTVLVLFDARGPLRSSPAPARRGGAGAAGPGSVIIQTAGAASYSNPINPETIAIAALTLGMVLVALVSVGGFSVLAQRRLRAFGMLESLGATDRHVRLVVRANGTLVGGLGAVGGVLLALVLWLASRPLLENSAHHLIGTFALPWPVVGASVGLALLATYLAALRPARSITAVPIVAALSGRPAPPRRLHRSVLPGIGCLVGAVVLLSVSGASGSSGADLTTGTKNIELGGGLLLLIPGIVLLAPFLLATLGRLGRRAPVGVRLALRDLARYRARSGAALAAISLGVLIAAIVSLVSAARYGNVLDYAGPNLAPNQLAVYGPTGSPAAPGPPGKGPTTPTARQLRSMTAGARAVARTLGASTLVPLETTSATLQHAAAGRNFNGTLYVATPQLLAAFGIKAARLSPDADILSMRPGFASLTRMQLVFGGYFSNGPPAGNGQSFPCPRRDCLANPVIEEVPGLPSGTSAPNTVITEHAVHQLGLTPVVSGWLVATPSPLTAAQISDAQSAAAQARLTVETRNDVPSAAEIIDYATVFGALLALAILAMTLGLIRSEAASDLRTLAATGASGATRRTITAATAGALALAGAVLGTGAGYLAVLGYLRSNSFNGGLSALGNVPVLDLLGILVIMPVAATLGGWLLGGRQPRGLVRQPIE
jgi:putative ABC transport system permease protein